MLPTNLARFILYTVYSVRLFQARKKISLGRWSASSLCVVRRRNTTRPGRRPTPRGPSNPNSVSYGRASGVKYGRFHRGRKSLARGTVNMFLFHRGKRKRERGRWKKWGRNTLLVGSKQRKRAADSVGILKTLCWCECYSHTSLFTRWLIWEFADTTKDCVAALARHRIIQVVYLDKVTWDASW